MQGNIFLVVALHIVRLIFTMHVVVYKWNTVHIEYQQRRIF